MTSSIYQNQPVIFNAYRHALIDLLHDLAQIRDEGYTVIHNIDYYYMNSVIWDYNPQVSHPAAMEYGHHSMKNLENSSPVTNWCVTRATMYEIIQSLLHEVERLGKNKMNISHLDRLRTAAQEAGNPDAEFSSQVEFSQRLNSEIRSIRRDFQGFSYFISLLESGKIRSVYDVLGYEEVTKYREDIDKMTEEIFSKSGRNFNRKTYLTDEDRNHDIQSKMTDDRNFALSMVIQDNFPQTTSTFVTPEKYQNFDRFSSEIRRSITSLYFETSFLSSLGSSELERNFVLVEAAKSAHKDADDIFILLQNLSGYNITPPDFLVRKIYSFIDSYMTPLERKPLEDVRKELSKIGVTTTEIRDAMTDTQEQYIEKAKQIIEAMPFVADDLYNVLPIEQNPRSEKVSNFIRTGEFDID